MQFLSSSSQTNKFIFIFWKITVFIRNMLLGDKIELSLLFPTRARVLHTNLLSFFLPSCITKQRNSYVLNASSFCLCVILFCSKLCNASNFNVFFYCIVLLCSTARWLFDDNLPIVIQLLFRAAARPLSNFLYGNYF